MNQVTHIALAAALLTPSLPGLARAQFAEPDVQVLHAFAAEADGDSFGFVAEAIGDVDRDRITDFVIGAPASNAGGTLSGRAYVYSGASGRLLATHTGNPQDRLGYGVASLGDIDGDRVPDYAVSGPGTFGNGHPGRLLVISGASHQVRHDLHGTPDSFFGYDINTAGDVDGDRRDDIIVGSVLANAQAGRVTMISSRDGAILWQRDGTAPGGVLGSAVSGVADRDGDRVPDQAVGAFGAGPAGTGLAYVLSGADGSLLDTLVPAAETAGAFGWFFAHDAGDVDGDRTPDIYVSDFADTALGPNSGRGYVFSGATGEEILTIEAGSPGEGLGMARGAGDIDRDRRADLVLGAYTNSDMADKAGRALLVSGCDGTVLRTFTGTVAGHELGFDVVPLGDVSRDRNPDYLITGVDVAYVVAGQRHERRRCRCHPGERARD